MMRPQPEHDSSPPPGSGAELGAGGRREKPCPQEGGEDKQPQPGSPAPLEDLVFAFFASKL